jgi:hypothetical protein
MVKVYLPNFAICTLSLAVNLLVLGFPLRGIAQDSVPNTNNQEATNIASSSVEPEILSEINRVRTNPQSYALWLETQKQYYDQIWLKLPGEKPVRAHRLEKAIDEAIAVLKKQQPLPPLNASEQTKVTANQELENFATGNNNIQDISYGKITPKGIVMSLVVDELFPDRRRRKSLLSPDAKDTGVVCKNDPRYDKVCAIAYSDSVVDDVAKQPATESIASQPETPTTAEKPTPPETPTTAEKPTPPETPTTAEKPTPPETSTTAEKPTPPETTTTAEKPTPPETPTTAEKPTPPETPTTAEKPTPPETETTGNEPDISETPETSESAKDPEVAVEIPQPPQPQVIPTPTVTPEAEKPATEEVEVAQTDTEEEVEAENEQPEAELDEEQEDLEAEDSESTEKVEVFEAEEDPKSTEEQIATNSDDSQLLENVERGILKTGDRVIAEDGSFYDSYPLDGQSGESFTISLESDEFDAFVALIDAKGNIVEQNDDIDDEDSNSRIKVTIPENGVYNVIVNAYDEGGTGQYVLTISR